MAGGARTAGGRDACATCGRDARATGERDACATCGRDARATGEHGARTGGEHCARTGIEHCARLMRAGERHGCSRPRRAGADVGSEWHKLTVTGGR